jgi:hypothetical protein
MAATIQCNLSYSSTSNSNFKISDCHFQEISSSIDHGGTIKLTNALEFKIEKTRFQSCSASAASKNGGAVYFDGQLFS